MSFSRILPIALVLLLVGVGGWVVARLRQPAVEPVTGEQFLMGTYVKIKLFGPKAAMQAAFDRIAALDRQMSRTASGSDVGRINQHAGKEWVSVSEDTYHVVQEALKYAELTGGLFDPTVAPLVDLWSIGTEKARVPASEELREALKSVDYRQVQLDARNRRVKLATAGMGLDLGGIAKGYAADEVVELLREKGIDSAFISLGGNVYVIGSKPDGSPWRIGIQDPFGPRGNYVAVLEVSDTSIVTSGPYERYFIKDGKRYHHILDPRTGWPADSGLVSVTIIADTSLAADALSTGVYIMGVEKGLTLLEQLPGIEGILITDSKEVFATSGARDMLTYVAKDFRLK